MHGFEELVFGHVVCCKGRVLGNKILKPIARQVASRRGACFIRRACSRDIITADLYVLVDPKPTILLGDRAGARPSCLDYLCAGSTEGLLDPVASIILSNKVGSVDVAAV